MVMNKNWTIQESREAQVDFYTAYEKSLGDIFSQGNVESIKRKLEQQFYNEDIRLGLIRYA